MAQLENELLQSFVRKVCLESSRLGKETPPETRGSSARVEKRPEKVSAKGRRRRIKAEELYTDKDRAAAVNMGNKDIKQSLKIKRQQDRSNRLHIPDEASPGEYVGLGRYQMAKGDYHNAIDFIDKALELNPLEKSALVARSKCYNLLGQPEKGFEDAEKAYNLDKTYLQAIYQKAESLYNLGDFEHSLMYFHRGLHLRPDMESFKLGAQKSRTSIENALDRKVGKEEKVGSSGKRKLLKELDLDKVYLEGLLQNPEVKSLKKGKEKGVLGCIEEAVDYLNKREEFWRQQLPPNNVKSQSSSRINSSRANFGFEADCVPNF